ncbi:hypothetical protein FIBSPDRAFT_850841 [Athelia psychrophila]|uniref:Uncharacterized protein n=1 Tax=Athelia psychrophila TaxID=1759441 RepID=A0A166T2V2_9AGAM|nr:hypothetical protein FIBSPDRAFT_850841 [Fibularhizoctonia sp. CBS 109695]
MRRIPAFCAYHRGLRVLLHPLRNHGPSPEAVFALLLCLLYRNGAPAHRQIDAMPGPPHAYFLPFPYLPTERGEHHRVHLPRAHLRLRHAGRELFRG